MLAYRVSWGRYTRLSGLLILPVASILTIEVARQRDKQAAMLSTLAMAGLLLTHYRVFAFYVCGFHYNKIQQRCQRDLCNITRYLRHIYMV